MFNLKENKNTAQKRKELTGSTIRAKKKKKRLHNVSNLPIWKEEEMFAAWCLCDTKKDAAQACGISVPTLTTYQKRFKWDERLVLIKDRLSKEVDGDIVIMKKRRLLEIENMIEKARLSAMTVKYKTAGEAVHSYVKMLEKQLLLHGEATDRRETVITRAITRYQNNKKASDKEKELHARELSPNEYVVDSGHRD